MAPYVVCTQPLISTVPIISSDLTPPMTMYGLNPVSLVIPNKPNNKDRKKHYDVNNGFLLGLWPRGTKLINIWEQYFCPLCNLGLPHFIQNLFFKKMDGFSHMAQCNVQHKKNVLQLWYTFLFTDCHLCWWIAAVNY